ncbi:metal ion binding [Ascochyta rabiei]|uniref:Metal ion binding n=1 Tax=Didymella rabiei TaxID=5454 RepID=A0A163IS79_DIDRA|nr:metal ion binding [Ascochyta rabiei]
MRTTTVLTALLPAALSSVVPVTGEDPPALSFENRQDITLRSLEGKSLQADVYAGVASLSQKAYQASKQPTQRKTCNPQNIIVRREWSAFSTAEKKGYISAVQCMAELPPKFPKSLCTGCQNRFDDFVATHIRQTFSIHSTGNLLPWHRFLTYIYEKTLRDELNIPHGSGGGCIASGPMQNWSVNLGPVFTDLTCTPDNPIFDYADPTTAGQRWSNGEMVTKLLNSKDLKTFWYDMQGDENAFSNNFIVHTAGHFTVGDDPGSDFLTSPGDPYFYAHHAQIDRVW